MKNQFLVLTTPEDTEVLIGISNIALIEPNPNNHNQTAIMLNFVPHKDGWLKTIYVKEELGIIKSVLGLK